ncbi:MAG: UDP-2,3-diacylglucosamine diphosphatase [Rikenellaceae bacterium]
MGTRFKTIVISDTHIGSKWSHLAEVTAFLKENTSELLILNGDIIDGWHLMRNRKRWKKSYNDFMTLMLDIQKRNTQIIYLRGNHDDFLDNVVPFKYENFSIVKSFIYESFGNRYYVFHGDLFDDVTSKIRWASKVGDKLYSFLLQINRYYNDHRRRHGKEYFSISKVMKNKVKNFVSSFSKFDSKIEGIARKNNCSGVIAGHIHQAEIRDINGITYLNSGDWIESLTALTEDLEGQWNIYQYKKGDTRN